MRKTVELGAPRYTFLRQLGVKFDGKTPRVNLAAFNENARKRREHPKLNARYFAPAFGIHMIARRKSEISRDTYFRFFLKDLIVVQNFDERIKWHDPAHYVAYSCLTKRLKERFQLLVRASLEKNLRLIPTETPSQRRCWDTDEFTELLASRLEYWSFSMDASCCRWRDQDDALTIGWIYHLGTEVCGSLEKFDPLLPKLWEKEFPELSRRAFQAYSSFDRIRRRRNKKKFGRYRY